MTRSEATLSMAAAALCLVLIWLLPFGSLPRVAAALVLLSFLPGYVLTGLLLPSSGLDGWIRVLASAGFSLAAVGLLALGLHVLDVESSAATVAVAAAIATAALALISLIGGKPASTRTGLSDLNAIWLVVLLLALGLGGLIGRALSPSAAVQPFTTFGVVGPDGTAQSLPHGEKCEISGVVTLQIRSHEREPKTFEVWRTAGNGTGRLFGPIQLAPGESRDVAVAVGGPAPIRFELRTPGVAGAYRSLRICTSET